MTISKDTSRRYSKRLVASIVACNQIAKLAALWLQPSQATLILGVCSAADVALALVYIAGGHLDYKQLIKSGLLDIRKDGSNA